MSLKLSTSKKHSKSKLNTEHIKIDVFKTLDAENFCSNTTIYEISYNQIARKWLVCFQCLELDFFNTGIQEKVRIQT